MTVFMPTRLAILVVDDSEDDLILYKRALLNVGDPFEIHLLPHPSEVLELLPTLKIPALVITDVKMPEMTGIQLAAHIKSVPELRRTPVMALTSSCMPSDIAAFYDAGGNAYFKKPADFLELKTLFECIFNHWRFAHFSTPPTS